MLSEVNVFEAITTAVGGSGTPAGVSVKDAAGPSPSAVLRASTRN